jgi:hypothetical protein
MPKFSIPKSSKNIKIGTFGKKISTYTIRLPCNPLPKESLSGSPDSGSAFDMRTFEVGRRVARFLGAIYQNGKKYTK